MKRRTTFSLAGIVLGFASVLLPGCADETDGSPGEGNLDQVYLVSSSLALPEGSSGFASLLGSLDPTEEELDLENAFEFPGFSDFWVRNGSVYVSGGDAPTITRYQVSETGELIEEETLSFASFGVSSSAFWNNAFASDTKSYMQASARELVIWNPTTMEITGSIEIPEIENRDGLMPTFSLADRGSLVHDGFLYQLIYWTGPDFARRDAQSRILVHDVERDVLVDTIEAPCPGLDFASVDEETGMLYFSPWTGGAGATLVLDNASTCVVELDPSSRTISRTIDFSAVADGREGAAFRSLGGGQFVFSAFHDEEVDLQAAIDQQDPFTIISDEAWRLWRYDANTGESQMIEDVDWNSGAAYWFVVDGETLALIPAANFASSTIYRVRTDGSADTLFDYSGFTLRLFRVR